MFSANSCDEEFSIRKNNAIHKNMNIFLKQAEPFSIELVFSSGCSFEAGKLTDNMVYSPFTFRLKSTGAFYFSEVFSSYSLGLWIPAFAGMTEKRCFFYISFYIHTIFGFLTLTTLDRVDIPLLL